MANTHFAFISQEGSLLPELNHIPFSCHLPTKLKLVGLFVQIYDVQNKSGATASTGRMLGRRRLNPQRKKELKL